MQLKPDWTAFPERLLAHFTTQSTAGRTRSMFIVVLLIAGIGISDYFAGIYLSLVFFYFVPITLALVWLGWREAVIVALASVLVRVIGDLIANGNTPLPLWSLWNAASALTIFLFMILILNSLLSLHRQLEKRVNDRTVELVNAAKVRRQLEQELLEVGSRERNAIGQDLHDDICQHLVGTALAAKVLARHLAEENNPHTNDAQAIVGWVEEGAENARRIARGLLLAAIDPIELPEKLSELADESTGAGVPCRFVHDGNRLFTDAGVAAQLFRIAQEATRNAMRHANSTRIEISLTSDAEAIHLLIEDDGGGLPAVDGRGAGMGLRIMSHRAAFVGATLFVESIPGSGARVICRLPIKPGSA